ncbi:MAG: ATP-dependent RNA helicase HrpA [Candidatus Latescibacteria bacterium]|nr:ATP-dependent RNA helicase HrpA [Candidatus Latescibacterota bacterium]
MLAERVRLGRRLQELRRSRRPPGPELEKLRRRAEASVRLREERRQKAPAVSYPAELPIAERKDEILQAIKDHPVVIVAGETGSGKTTQLPKICLEAGRGVQGRIGVTQPRRVAALSLSRRLAEELGVGWGREVGCKIRFSDQTSPQTYIKMMTDGVLLAEIHSDPQLLEYDTLIIDEAHERSLNIDFLLGYLRQVRQRHPDLKLIITSATIDTEAFSQAFDQAPVIQVSGRLYPVETRHWPLEELMGEGEDLSYTEGAAMAVERLLAEAEGGDALVFMPTERDIRETCQLLEGRLGSRVEVLPLFSRLTAAEQQRVFSLQGRRRVVVATNIAETSLTIPGIRYVVDTGLTRLSRYNPRNQTQRLPIEPISQSSAAQRQGRCGRVTEGICVRLYPEAELLARPYYTQPEIQRANLAEVILRMLDLGLGQVEDFPFLDPPQPQAIRGGYQLLEELGSIDGQRRLTPLGRRLARLPTTPTVARMLLQAQEEGALEEVLVIAAGISAQDPRERPADQQEAADQMHRRFAHAQSDFLVLLNIWKAYHTELDELQTQSRMRRFCRTHFLSYMRMREWRDIHAQLSDTLRELGDFTWNPEPASYEAVHRAITSGLLSNIARKKEHNLYQAARSREAMLFPGSGLFQKKTPRAGSEGEDKSPDKGAPPWIVAAEMVETSRLFARTAARIDPAWLLDLGGHLCRFSYKDPAWNTRSGRVLVRQTATLYGLEIATQQVPYSRVDPKAATELFIRQALVEDQIRASHAFLEHNRRLREKVETWQTRVRSREGVDVDQAVYEFYARHLEEVSSVHDLNRLVRARRAAEPRFLFMTEEDLLGDRKLRGNLDAFPDALMLDGQELALEYAYRPGQDEDGVTVKLPYKLVDAIDPQVLEWLVPGLLEEKIACLLRSLPKALRRQLMPINDKAAQIAAQLQPTHHTFLESLEVFVATRYGVRIQPGDWDLSEVPEHLRMRVEVQGVEGKPVLASRDLEALTQQLERHDTPTELAAWRKAAAEWSREGLKGWTLGDLPQRVEVAAVAGLPLWGCPGLEVIEGGVNLKLYKVREEAEAGNRAGLLRLYEQELAAEMAYLKKEMGALSQLKDLYRSLGTLAELQEDALIHLKNHLFGRDQLYPLDEASYLAGKARAQERLRGLAPPFLDLVESLLQVYKQIRLCLHPYPGIETDVQRLLPKHFLRQLSYERLPHLLRYLKAVLLRAERARLNPAKDAQRAAQVRPYQEALDRFPGSPAAANESRRVLAEECRWLVEEFRVSLFAQELGTAQPVSIKRLAQKFEQLEQGR